MHSFAGNTVKFYPSLGLGFLLTEHGSLNEYPYKKQCKVYACCSKWKLAICILGLYPIWMLLVNQSGIVYDSMVLMHREQHKCLNRFAVETKCRNARDAKMQVERIIRSHVVCRALSVNLGLRKSDWWSCWQNLCHDGQRPTVTIVVALTIGEAP